MNTENTRPIRVLHIASGDLWAGAEVQLFTLVKALKNNTNTKVDVILLNHGLLERKLVSSGIKVIVLDESKLNGLNILWKLIFFIHQIQPDIVHTHRLKENILGSVATRLNGNIPSLRTTHGAPEQSPSWKQPAKRIVKWLNLFCGRYLQHAIVAVSADLADKLNTDYPSKKIHVIENGIDLPETSRQVINNKTDNLTSTFRIGFAGRLVSVKRVDILIKTARYILDKYPQLNVRFHIFGDGPLRDELEQLSRKLNTDTIVTFEGHSDDILKKVQELNALLISSDHEGLPMILLEAMALGTPVISHAVGGIPHVLDQGNCGILISENRPCDYALAIDQLANSPEKVSLLTRMARQRVNERYTANANAQAHCLLYNSLIK